MKIQETDWGYVEWQHLREEGNPNQSLSVGKTLIFPGKTQIHHVHYGQEQVVYILSGEGLYTINGTTRRYGKGTVIYMEAGSTHETVNDTDAPLCELLISNPISGAREISMEAIQTMEASGSNLLYAATESLRSQLIDPLNLPLIIFDAQWQTVLQTPYFPDFCKRHCNPEKTPESCACMKACTFVGTASCKEFICPMNLRIYSVPIVHNGNLIGVVRGGFILLSGSHTKKYQGLYDMPESAAHSIKKLLAEIANTIVTYCVFDDARRDLSAKEEAIQAFEKNSAILEKNLMLAQDTVTNLKINHHFLFNTLNCMASMALRDGSERLYDSIIDLADLFRYTMKTDCRFIAFEKELAYLNNYLNLQKLRYRKGLNIVYDLSDDLLGAAVPFNFLQPIVENAFIHGFSKAKGEKRLYIRSVVESQRARITIKNNGTAIDPITLNRVNRSLASSGHGLSMIYAKLTSAFGENFTMHIDSDQGEVIVKIDIPVTYIQEEQHD
ncbi:MAG: histidine kinase [Eubacterium sp.]|nr:histidine kinase [Eubacterium sp.]